MAKNKIYEYVEKGIFTGNYPVVTDNLELKTAVEEGDIIGVSEAGEFGKLDKETYKEPYAIAFDKKEEAGKTVGILAGEIISSFVKMEEAEAATLKVKLRNIGLFIKY